MYCVHCGCSLTFNFMLDAWEHTANHSNHCVKDNAVVQPLIRTQVTTN